MPFHVKHGSGIEPPPSQPQPLAAGTGPGSHPVHLDAFLLSAASFSSTGNPALFTRDSIDSPGGAAYAGISSHPQGGAPAQPTRFAEARRVAAASRQ